MIKGYDEHYLDDAMKNLGESLDYAVNVCKIDPDQYMELFIASGISELFEKGNPKYISGQSGSELALDVMCRIGGEKTVVETTVEYDRSPEYWAGWVLAYYQWLSGRSFRDIFDKITVSDVLKMYPTLHEASEERFADAVENIMKRRKSSCKLQEQRKRCGYSQSELAKKADVNLRTLQQYELRTKDLSKASVVTVLSLSNVLGCRVEDILE